MIESIDWNAVLSSGVFVQGLAALAWAIKTEMRVTRLELKGGAA